MIRYCIQYYCTGHKLWAFTIYKDDIEKVHVKFLEQILSVRRQTNTIRDYGELGFHCLFYANFAFLRLCEIHKQS